MHSRQSKVRSRWATATLCSASQPCLLTQEKSLPKTTMSTTSARFRRKASDTACPRQAERATDLQSLQSSPVPRRSSPQSATPARWLLRATTSKTTRTKTGQMECSQRATSVPEQDSPLARLLAGKRAYLAPRELTVLPRLCIPGQRRLPRAAALYHVRERAP